jgi:peroxiredoxin
VGAHQPGAHRSRGAQLRGKSVRDELRRAFDGAMALDAPLAQKLEVYSRASRALLPDVQEGYDRLVQRIAANGAAPSAPRVGDELPDCVLPDADGCLVSIMALLASGPLVVSFNRGAWCPYCRLELAALSAVYSDILALGAAAIVIVPEPEEQARALKETCRLPFTVLSDRNLGYALTLGLVFWLGEELKSMHLQAGIDLGALQRNDGWFLPIPATFVVGRDGRVLDRFLDPDFRKRMPIDQIMGALRPVAANT